MSSKPSSKENPSPEVTRRQLLQWGLVGGAGALLLPEEAEARPRLSQPSIPGLGNVGDIGSMVQGYGWRHNGLVVSAQSPDVYPIISSAPNAATVQRMVNAIMMKLSGQATPSKAWGSMFGQGDRVGILIDEHGNHRTRTRQATIQAVIAGLRSAGVSLNQIVIWCQFGRYLPTLGYKINLRGRGLKAVGADQVGYNRRYGLKMKRGMFGKTLGLSNIVTSLCTHIINIASLEDHPIIGARLSLAQQAMSSLQGGQIFARRWGGVGIGTVAAWNIMRQRFVLHFVDGLAGAYNGGLNAWHPETIFGGTDPVALDRIAFGYIESERQRTGKPQISGTRRAPTHINHAAANAVGVANLLRIRHLRLRVK